MLQLLLRQLYTEKEVAIKLTFGLKYSSSSHNPSLERHKKFKQVTNVVPKCAKMEFPLYHIIEDPLGWFNLCNQNIVVAYEKMGM